MLKIAWPAMVLMLISALSAGLLKPSLLPSEAAHVHGTVLRALISRLKNA